MQGNLSQISLNDILLLATGGKKSGVLKLSRGKENVEVYFQEGNIIHATCPIGDGEKAILYPVTWGDGSFSLFPNGVSPAPTIKKTSGEILEILRIPYAYTAKVIFNLHKSNLVELVPTSKSTADFVPTALLNRLTGILTEIIGPMAALVLRDQIQALGESPENYPEAKLDELISLAGGGASLSIQKNQFHDAAAL